jgi:hypothetical protein
VTIVEQLRRLASQDPFFPLVIREKSGHEILIGLPEQLHIWPGGVRVVVMERTGDDASGQNLDVASIEEVFAIRPKEATSPMTIKKFDEFMKRRPFEPFTVYVADGSKIAVIGPEFASRTQSGRTIFVSTGGERTECIDLLLVARLSTGVQNTSSQRTDAA